MPHCLLLIIALLGSPLIPKAQPRNMAAEQPGFSPYQIDKKLYSKIRDNFSVRNDSTIGKMEYKVFQNDSLVYNYTIPLVTKTVINNDTISILGVEVLKGGGMYHFDLTIVKNNFRILPLEWNGEGIVSYKKTASDTDWVFSSHIPCKTNSLVCSRKPNFQAGDILYGMLEFTSLEYENVRLGKRQRVEFKAYFSSK